MGKQSPPSAQPAVMTAQPFQRPAAFTPGAGQLTPGAGKQALQARLPQARTNLIAAHPVFSQAQNPLYRALQANSRMGGRRTTMPVATNSV